MSSSERRAFWREHVEAWQSSGESQAAYCRRHELSAVSFSQWKRRIERERLAALTPDERERAALVEVQLAEASHAESSGVSVELDDVRLHLARGFDPATLQRAIAAVRDAGR